MNYPLISLIIPCYNAEKTLEKCMISVMGQTYGNLEIIIVDDGSTDGSSQIYSKHQSQDDRIKVIKQKNAGVSKARNVGLQSATGAYICFVDSDDWVEANYCAKLFQLITNENADIAIIEASYEDEEGQVIFEKPTTLETTFQGRKALSLLLEDTVIQSHPWGKLYKSSLVKDLSFPENIKCFEDYSTLFKIFDKAEKVVRSNDKLYHYIQRDDSLSHDLSPKTAYYFYIAIMEVFRFWQGTRKVENQQKIAKNFVKKLLMVLKRILRQTSKEEMKNEKEAIRQSFTLFLKYPAKTIGLEYYFYLRLYYYFPNLYTKLISKK